MSDQSVSPSSRLEKFAIQALLLFCLTVFSPAPAPATDAGVSHRYHRQQRLYARRGRLFAGLHLQ
jgi:hypothetical protein